MANKYINKVIAKECYCCSTSIPDFVEVNCTILTDYPECVDCPHYEICDLRGDPCNAPVCPACI